jgi:chromosome segregation ATPase
VVKRLGEKLEEWEVGLQRKDDKFKLHSNRLEKVERDIEQIKQEVQSELVKAEKQAQQVKEIDTEKWETSYKELQNQLETIKVEIQKEREEKIKYLEEENQEEEEKQFMIAQILQLKDELFEIEAQIRKKILQIVDSKQKDPNLNAEEKDWANIPTETHPRTFKFQDLWQKSDRQDSLPEDE